MLKRHERISESRRTTRTRVMALALAAAALTGLVSVVQFAQGDASSQNRTSLPARNSFAQEMLSLRRMAINYVTNEALAAGRLAPGDPAPEPYPGPVAAQAGSAGGFHTERRSAVDLGAAILRTLCGVRAGNPPAVRNAWATPADYWTAFERGWVAHFAAVAFDNSAFTKEAANSALRCVAAHDYWARRLERERSSGPGMASLLYPLWHERYGWASTLRAVRGGLPGPWLSSGQSLRRDGDIVPDGSEFLLNGDMVGSVIYAIVTDPRVQATYRPARFYAAFLPPGSTYNKDSPPPAETFSPLQNAYLKVFHVLARSVRPGSIRQGPSPLITLVSEYARQFPDEAPAVYDDFLRATDGLTVDPSIAGYLPPRGRAWDAYERDRHSTLLEQARERLVRGEIAPDASVRYAPETAGETVTAEQPGGGRIPWGGPYYRLNQVLVALVARVILSLTAWGLAKAAFYAIRRAWTTDSLLELGATRTPGPIRSRFGALLWATSRLAGMVSLSLALMVVLPPVPPSLRMIIGVVAGVVVWSVAGLPWVLVAPFPGYSRSLARREVVWSIASTVVASTALLLAI
ncbi:MAG: hypothetical protein HPY55_02330 [Firmicutes bacterium]|nr:hypothetical protein [Bacillota bacterium]